MMEQYYPKTLGEFISVLKELSKLYGSDSKLHVVQTCNRTESILNAYLKSIKIGAKNLLPSIYCYKINYVSVYNNSNKPTIILAIGDDNTDESLSRYVSSSL